MSRIIRFGRCAAKAARAAAQALGVPVLTEQEFLAMMQDAPAEQETT